VVSALQLGSEGLDEASRDAEFTWGTLHAFQGFIQSPADYRSKGDMWESLWAKMAPSVTNQLAGVFCSAQMETLSRQGEAFLLLAVLGP
jgi:hypothetical protein